MGELTSRSYHRGELQAHLAAHAVIGQTEPALDRALDEARHVRLRSLDEHAIVVAAPACEHAEPGQEAVRGWLPLDDEQLIDAIQHEPTVGMTYVDRHVIDVDHDLTPRAVRPGDGDRDAQNR